MTAEFSPLRIATEGTRANPEVVFAHACGLCKEVWRPVVAELSYLHSDLSWMSVDLRGHGDSATGEPPYEMDLLARDLVETVPEGPPSVGVGHSSGGAVVARAETIKPGMFRHLVLIEPIIFPPPYRRVDIQLAKSAERRRQTFTDQQAAFVRFTSGPFGTWKPEALAMYVNYGFAETARGLQIKCQPLVEADLFREGLNHDTWDRVVEIATPVTIVVGEYSDTHPEPVLSGLAGQFKDATTIVVPDAGHFVPMERPDVIAGIVADVLEGT
ncbi:MAG: alpha/beta hydrolase [Acidimicrobiia bacterium]|nr:MAG: alpha/beta hydrolase [Acidimicrobiia bacterium]